MLALGGMDSPLAWQWGNMLANRLLMSGGGAIGPAVASIQQVSITITAGSTSNTATISAVDVANSIIIYGGFTVDWSVNAIDMNDTYCGLEITNSTTITATRNDTADSVTYNATIVEFNDGWISNKQAGIITISGTSSNTATLSPAFDIARSIVLFCGQTTGTSSEYINTNAASQEPFVYISSSTQVTAARSGTSGSLPVYYMAVEFSAAKVESVQQFEIDLTGTTSNAATISAVDTSNAVLFMSGKQIDENSWANVYPKMTLTNSTTVTATCNTASTATKIRGVVLEFAVGIVSSIQRFSSEAFGSGSTTKDTTITAVDTSRAFVSFLGINSTTGSTDISNSVASRVAITSSTNVRLTRQSSAANTITASFDVIEFNV